MTTSAATGQRDARPRGGPASTDLPAPTADRDVAVRAGAQPAATTRAATADPAVEVRDLVKRYGPAEVLHGVSFTVARGELFGLVGRNGAGKTTTVEVLQGLRRPTSGTARVLGLDPAAAGDELRRRIGSQLQDAALPARLRVGEALRLMASLHPAPRPLDEVAAEWRLDRLWRRPFAALSGGERQRLFVALALVGRPELVFLDELTQNLDPVSRRHTWDVVRQIRDRGTTVVLVTHDVEEAERLCDRVAVLHAGRVVAEGTPAQVVEGSGWRSSVRFTDPDIDVRTLRALPGAEQVGRAGPEVVVAGTGPLLAHVGAHLVAAGRPALDLRVHHPSLEDAFVRLTAPATDTGTDTRTDAHPTPDIDPTTDTRSTTDTEDHR